MAPSQHAHGMLNLHYLFWSKGPQHLFPLPHLME